MGMISDMSGYNDAEIYCEDQNPKNSFNREEFTESVDFSGSDLIWVEKNGVYGYLNRHTRRLLKPGLDYECALPFSCGRGVVKRNGKWGAIDEKGNVVVSFIYESLTMFVDDIAYCQLNGKYGCIDLNGTLICEPKYEFTGAYHEDYCAVKLGGKWGYVDKQGDKICAFAFDVARPFSCGLAGVMFDDKWNFINCSGKIAIQSPSTSPYQDCCDFVDGYAGVKQKGKWGYIDTDGAKAVPCRYQEVGSFKDNMFPVKKDDKWGYIENANEEKFVVPCMLLFPLAEDENLDTGVITKIQNYYKAKINNSKSPAQIKKYSKECEKEVARYKKARKLYNEYINHFVELDRMRNKGFNDIDNID